MNKRRLILVSVSLGLCISLCSLLSIFAVRHSITNSKLEKKYYTDTYSGKIQSFLDVYKDIWNASTPEEMNINRVYKYEEPLIFDALRYNSFMPRGGFEFCPIFTEGTIYDDRLFETYYSYIFSLDFSDQDNAPDPYFVGKTVNALFGLGTISFKDKEKYSDQSYWNLSYLMLECDGHLFSCYQPEDVPNFMSYHDKSRLYFKKNPTKRFSGSEEELLSFSRNSFLESKIASGKNFYDDDGFALGISYPQPINFSAYVSKNFSSDENKYNGFPYLSSITLNISGSGTLTGGHDIKNSFLMSINDIKQYVSLNNVDIPSPYNLVNPYLKEYEAVISTGSQLKDNKHSYEKVCYYSNGWRMYISPGQKNPCHPYTFYYSGKKDSDDLPVSFCDKPAKIRVKCITLGGDDWRPTNPILGIPEFTNLKVTNPVKYFQAEAIAKLFYPGQIGNI